MALVTIFLHPFLLHPINYIIETNKLFQFYKRHPTTFQNSIRCFVYFLLKNKKKILKKTFLSIQIYIDLDLYDMSSQQHKTTTQFKFKDEPPELKIRQDISLLLLLLIIINSPWLIDLKSNVNKKIKFGFQAFHYYSLIQ